MTSHCRGRPDGHHDAARRQKYHQKYRQTRHQPTGAARATAHIGVNTRVAVLVVCASLFGVREHLVGFFDLFELPLSRGIALVAVRVVFHGQLAIGFLYFVVAGVFGNSQNFVKISFCHIQKLAMR